MRRPLLGLVFTLLAALSAAPQAGATDAGLDDTLIRTGAYGTSLSGPSGRNALAIQQAARDLMASSRPSRDDLPGLDSPLDEAAAAGLSLLPEAPALPRARPVVMKASRPLQCVPYARQLSGIALRGDAWTWWKKADGRYEKGKAPRAGAVLVLSKTRRLRLGHLAVVVEVLDSRNIVVHQANWLNGGRIHRYTPVRDVSPKNDWSEVRVWYTPGRQLGSRAYPAYGFIYPNPKGSPDVRQAAN
ncbi:MAG: CHAP domain-containing protein [Kiloniellaceae bacterium]